jgi:hypothetical protein
MTEEIDPTMKPMEAACLQAAVDRVRAESGGQQLAAGQDTVLSSRKLGESSIDRCP